ncbi:MAG: hypothetical protein ACI845_003991, partial [Gammaproteobacteria bacterium]
RMKFCLGKKSTMGWQRANRPNYTERIIGCT